MNPAEIAGTIEALTGIAHVLEKLGMSGLIALALSGPALVLTAILCIEYHRGRKMHEMVEAIRAETRVMLETYRADTQGLVRELGNNQEKTDRYYRDNVELVKRYELVSKNLQDVVIGNTTVLTELKTMLKERGRHI